MPKYVIEHDIPALGELTPEELRAVAQKSRSVLTELGTGVQWDPSYVTQDKMFCVYVADDEELVREHARRGGFPADRVSAVSTIIGPVTAEG